MKRKLIIALISSLCMANIAFADYSYVDSSDYTGDSFFKSSMQMIESSDENKDNESKDENVSQTIPPIKALRLGIKKQIKKRKDKNRQLAPTNPESEIYNTNFNTSDYASKEVEENFDENMMPDGFEADDEAVNENKKAKHFWSKNKTNKNTIPEKNTEEIILDCDDMNYDTANYCLYANGNANVEFVKQQTIVKADKIVYDRANNTIKADGNVKILKHGQTITGDYIFVDMNEENALIENPVTETAVVQIRAKKGYVYGNKIVQEQGSIHVDHSFPIRVDSTKGGPRMEQMLLPQRDDLSANPQNGLITVDAKQLKITQRGEHEILAVKRASVKRGSRTVIKIPAIKLYTNKNHDFVESNIWELGTIHGLGMYVGPGFVFELPKGSVLKAMPILNYNHKIGVGAFGRFQSGTNFTQAAYGTAGSKILVRGKQKLDDNFYLLYGMNDYIDEWFLGKRRPKYGAALVYDKEYRSNGFLLKDLSSVFQHRVDLGYYHDIDEDSHYKKLHSGRIGTLRVRYMAEGYQSFYNKVNYEKQLALDIGVSGRISAALYGTGDTQMIGQLGPRMHTQVKRWMQDIGYYQSVYRDESPIPVYDAYRYGKSNVYLREYFRICRWLTLSWFGSLNLSGDSPNDKRFQENAFYVSFGPDDIKFSLGYDFIRENTFFILQMMMDAKGTTVNYDKLEIKQDKKAKKAENTEETSENEFKNSNKAPVLKRAEVEDIRTVEDVL